MGLNKQRVIEIVTGLEDYRQCKSEIDKKDFVNKDVALGPFVYQSSISCYEENYIKSSDGTYVLSPIVLINSGFPEFDATVIHELNHAFEQQTISVDEHGSISVTGWDKGNVVFKEQQEFSELSYSGITRDHELLSEYINDRISQEITDIFHNRGDYMLSPIRKKDTSLYMSVRVLAEEFFVTFKDVIIKSRSHNNIEYLYENVGKENFEALNEHRGTE